MRAYLIRVTGNTGLPTTVVWFILCMNNEPLNRELPVTKNRVQTEQCGVSSQNSVRRVSKQTNGASSGLKS